MNTLVSQIALEILQWIESFFTANNRLPTEDELNQHLQLDSDKYISIGDQWLIDHPKTGN